MRDQVSSLFTIFNKKKKLDFGTIEPARDYFILNVT